MENESDSGKQEAEATVRKSADGRYVDLSKDILTIHGITSLTEEQMIDLFGKLRLRYSLTPQCNIWCTFCSNEGSNYTSKTLKSADTNLVIKLSEMLLNNTPLKSIDFSGGEPTLHPDFVKGEFRIVEWTKTYPKIRFSLHSNAIELNPNLVDRIKSNFSRIGASINSVIFDTWNKMTNFHGIYPEKAQRKKFDRMMENLEYIANQNIGHKVFMKSVVMRGFNDSEEELSAFLDACAKYNFHPKFLQFDPQYASQKPLQVFLQPGGIPPQRKLFDGLAVRPAAVAYDDDLVRACG